jgi:hypothetical protein
MANIKISQLTSLSTMTDAAIIPVVAAGVTQQISGTNLKTYFGSYGNANVAANLAALGSNPITTTGNITAGNLDAVNLVINRISSDDSSFITIEDGVNVTGPISGLGSSKLDFITYGANTAYLTTTSDDTTALFMGSASAELYANTDVSIRANTGGTAQAWTFGSTGTLTVPAANGVPGRISTQTTVASEKGFDLSITAGNTNGCSVSGGDMYLSAGVGYNGISHGGGNVNIVTGDRYGNVTGNIWRFDSSGALKLPLSNVRIRDTVGNSVAFGLNAGLTLQGVNAVAIGSLAGNNRQGLNSVAIGNTAGAGGSVSTDYVSGAESPSTTLVVASTTGIGPGMIISGTGFFGNITVVTVTNSTTLEISASAGFTPSGTLTFTGSQGTAAVAIGPGAGSTNQGSGAVALGDGAGQSLQGVNAVAIGLATATTSQGSRSVAIGQSSGQSSQGADAVAIGQYAGNEIQGVSAVAIGNNAGYTGQGTQSVAIGASAGATSQGNNSIILNATGAALDQTTANTFTVAPVRNDVANVAEIMFYNATSKEITYGNVISVAGNVTAGNISAGSGTITGGNVNGANFNGNVAFGTGTIGGSGNISGGNLAISGNTATITSANLQIGYLEIPQVSLAANVTANLTVSGKHYYSTSASNLALTIADNSVASWPVGTAISVVNRGTANITVAPAAGVSLYLAGNATSGNRTVTTYGMATMMNVAANIWMISGTVV